MKEISVQTTYAPAAWTSPLVLKPKRLKVVLHYSLLALLSMLLVQVKILQLRKGESSVAHI